MRGSRRIAPFLLLALLVASAIGAPFTTAQVFSSDYCPPGDQDHGPPDPPGSGASRGHVDLKPGLVDLRFPEGDQLVEKRGVHLVARSTGNAVVDVEVKNVGNRHADVTNMQLTLERPHGPATTRTVDVPAVHAGTSQRVTTSFTLQEGQHVLHIEVNPERDVAEECRDGAPNDQCGSMASGCEYTYYENNKRSVGIIMGALPVLRVDTLQASIPDRATKTPHPDSETMVTLRVKNTGNTNAYNLDGLPHEALPFPVELQVPGCACPPKRLAMEAIPPGGQKVVSTTIGLHGLVDAFTVHADLDPDRLTADVDRRHAVHDATFPIPTPNLFAHVTTDHPTEGRDILVPEGQNITFTLHIHNQGDAEALTTHGKGVRVLVERDRAGTIVADERLVVPAGGQVDIQITDPWVQDKKDEEEEKEEQVYRIRVDPGDEIVESGKGGNERYVVAKPARFEAELRLDDDEDKIEVPPGVHALVAFTLENKGTITDTYRLETPKATADAYYQDMQGARINKLQLTPGETTRLQYAHKIPTDEAAGTKVEGVLSVRPQGTTTTLDQNVTFLVGEDTVAPKIRLHEPRTGFLDKDNKIVIEVTDNVAVKNVETDLFGSFEPIAQNDTQSNLYTLDATGTPNRFTLTVRATDTAGNEATQEITLIRDLRPPRIGQVAFTPASGVRPGDAVSIYIVAQDDHMDRVEIQVTQPRPNNTMYMENITFTGSGPRYIMHEWRVPERPGHYEFKVTAYDKAGNSAQETKRLYVRGLNIEIVTIQPTVVPAEPREGDRVRFTYAIRNTSPDFETGEFFVTFVRDFRRQIGLERVNLGPGEQRVITFHWIAEPGPHAFTFVVDQAEEVAEDNPDTDSNLHFTETGILFRDQELFAPERVQARTAGEFGTLLLGHWYIPLLLLVTMGMFAAAFVLQRRNAQE